MLHETRQSILVIESDSSLRRLITLGLEYRGLHVIEASSLVELPSLENAAPGLVVLDIDSDTEKCVAQVTPVRSHPQLALLPMVILAWDDAFPLQEQASPPEAQITYLSKPFDARTLYATIEEMLKARKEVVVVKEREAVLTTHFASSAPSLCPLVTAGGLLITVIGLMVQLALAGVGILIVLVALLWWTLGKVSAEQAPQQCA